MGRTNDPEYRLYVYLCTVVDFAYLQRGMPVGSERLVRLDPGAIGKIIQRHAIPRLSFLGSEPSVGISNIGAIFADAVGASSGGNLEHNSAHVHVKSDGHAARFHGRGPTLREFDAWIDLDDRLSPLAPVFFSPLVEANPFWVAPWRDAEMLGHCILKVFELAGPPLSKGMMPSVFDPMEPKRRRPLHQAARNGDLEALPPQGTRSRVQIDPVDTAGVTPLMLASEGGHRGIVERLLELGASHGARDDQGRTPVHYAARAGEHEAVSALLAWGADPLASDMFGDTPLHRAVANGSLESVGLLLEAGAEPNVADGLYLSTPLHVAARSNSAGVIALMVDGGANLETRNEAGRTPLHVAAAYGHKEAAESLIRLGADLDSRDHSGETPLHRPVFFQHTDMISLLIEHGASVSAQDNEGNTPLHVAGSMNRDTAARQLIEGGADVECKNHEGLTALDMAMINPHWNVVMEHNAEVADLLLRHGASIDPERLPIGDRHPLWPHLTPKELLFENGDINYPRLLDLSDAVRRRLPGKGGDTEDSTLSNVVAHRSLLHDAAIKNMFGLVEALLDNGASVMTGVRIVGTPLHSVAQYGTCEMAAFLLDRGADLEMPMRNTRHRGNRKRRWPWLNRKRDSEKTRGSRWPTMATPLDSSESPEMKQFLLGRGAEPFMPC